MAHRFGARDPIAHGWHQLSGAVLGASRCAARDYSFLTGGPPNFTNYGLGAKIAIGTSWTLYSASFTPTATANDARLEFWVGDVAGDVWFDDVQIIPVAGDVYRRDYTNGVVLLNGTGSQQTIPLEGGLRRLKEPKRLSTSTSWTTRRLASVPLVRGPC